MRPKMESPRPQSWSGQYFQTKIVGPVWSLDGDEKESHKRANIFFSWKRDEESLVVRRASKDGQRTPQVVLEKLLGGAPPPLLSLVTTHPVLLSHWSSWFQSLRVVIINESSSYATNTVEVTPSALASYNSWKKLTLLIKSKNWSLLEEAVSTIPVLLLNTIQTQHFASFLE